MAADTASWPAGPYAPGDHAAVWLDQRDFRRLCAGGSGVFLSGARAGGCHGGAGGRCAAAYGNYADQRRSCIYRKFRRGFAVSGGGSQDARRHRQERGRTSCPWRLMRRKKTGREDRGRHGSG